MKESIVTILYVSMSVIRNIEFLSQPAWPARLCASNRCLAWLCPIAIFMGAVAVTSDESDPSFFSASILYLLLCFPCCCRYPTSYILSFLSLGSTHSQSPLFNIVFYKKTVLCYFRYLIPHAWLWFRLVRIFNRRLRVLPRVILTTMVAFGFTV